MINPPTGIIAVDGLWQCALSLYLTDTIRETVRLAHGHNNLFSIHV